MNVASAFSHEATAGIAASDSDGLAEIKSTARAEFYSPLITNTGRRSDAYGVNVEKRRRQ
jgi:hypothetical protein